MEQNNYRRKFKRVKIVLILPIIFIIIAFLLNLFYSLPVKDSFLFYIAVFIYLYVPGRLIIRFLKFDKDEYFTNSFHSIAIGAALIPLLYNVVRRIALPEILYFFGIVSLIFWSIIVLRDFKRGKTDVFTSSSDILLVFVLIVFTFLLLHLSYFTDIVFFEKVFKVRNIHLTETDFHLGIINQLRNIFPPHFPYASGVDLYYYHLNMHLEIEMFNRFFTIDTIKLTYFYFPLLYFCLLVFMPYIFIHKYFGDRFVGFIASLLIFGSDFSFIPGLLGIIPTSKSWIELSSPVLWPLFTLNSFLPSLFIMFLCVLYLKEYSCNGNLLYLLMFCLLGFSAYGFKSSMGPHIMGSALFLGIIMMIFTKHTKEGKLICSVSALTILVILFDLIILRGGMGKNIIEIATFNRFQETLTRLGIFNFPWYIYPVIFFIYLLGIFSIRILCFYHIKDLFKKEHFNLTNNFLILFVISGFLLPELFFIGQTSYASVGLNNAMWFSFQSLTAAWFLLTLLFLKISHVKKNFLVFVLIILLSAPSTIQFLILRFTSSYNTVNANAIEIVKYFENVPPDSVILHPINPKKPSLASNYAGRIDVLSLYKSYILNEIEFTEAKNRIHDIELFFSTNAEINRTFFLKKYNVDYVYAPLSYAGILDNEPMLLQVMKNSEYAVYKVNLN